MKFTTPEIVCENQRHLQRIIMPFASKSGWVGMRFHIVAFKYEKYLNFSTEKKVGFRRKNPKRKKIRLRNLFERKTTTTKAIRSWTMHIWSLWPLQWHKPWASPYCAVVSADGAVPKRAGMHIQRKTITLSEAHYWRQLLPSRFFQCSITMNGPRARGQNIRNAILEHSRISLYRLKDRKIERLKDEEIWCGAYKWDDGNRWIPSTQ